MASNIVNTDGPNATTDLWTGTSYHHRSPTSMARSVASHEVDFWVEGADPTVPSAFVVSSRITMTGDSLNGVVTRCFVR
jgi:hypothetical protein